MLKNKAARQQYQKEYHKTWYAKPENCEAKKANAKKHREISRKRNIDYIYQYKLTHPCQKCADYHPD